MRSDPWSTPPRLPSQKKKDKMSKKQPKAFHFSCGNSDTGHCGFKATVVACNKTDAVKILRTAIEAAAKEVRLKDDEARQPFLGGVEWLNIQLNPSIVTKDDIDKVTDLSEGVFLD
jgi:hypothetical protein